ncbi:MAG: lipoate--protein ligase family protein [Symploca sp. SIO1A3]|nr:lipoate--protein ligase family protein [Symploca sp. SIO1A3]
MENWRLIPLLQASGTMQMAIDEWLLEQHRLGKHSPALRFYTWSSPTISLGYHQRRWPASWQQLTWREIPIQLVRRPTGGRAVLHQGDLTYMVVTSELMGKRLEVYQKICEFLIEGWRSLGINLHYGTAGRGYIHNPNCFGTATGADLVTAEGYKLIGSAQLRRGKAILQHGSIRLEPDAELFTQVFGEEKAEGRRQKAEGCKVESNYHCLSEFGITQQGNSLIKTVVEALTKAATDCFGVELELQPLSDQEWQQLKQLEIELIEKNEEDFDTVEEVIAEYNQIHGTEFTVENLKND